MKKADGSGAKFAVILGDDEVNEHVATLKPLREAGQQAKIALAELPQKILELIK